MKLTTIIRIIFKAFLIPIAAVAVLSKINFFDYLTLVPDDYKYEVGLTLYMALAETVCGFIEKAIEQRKAKVVCVFYLSESDKDISNTPLIVCDENIGVASIKYHLEISGNLERLRKCELNLMLPSWITSQITASDSVMSCQNNQLIWSMDKILPIAGFNNQIATCSNKISLIKTCTGDNLTIKLQPEMKKVFGVSFETNGFRIQNGE